LNGDLYRQCPSVHHRPPSSSGGGVALAWQWAQDQRRRVKLEGGAEAGKEVNAQGTMNPQLGGELDDLDFQSFNLKRADGYAIEFHYWYDDKPARVRCRHSVMSERMSHLNSQPFRRPRGNTGDSGSRIHQQLSIPHRALLSSLPSSAPADVCAPRGNGDTRCPRTRCHRCGRP